MSAELKACETAALMLSAAERAALAERLINSLDSLDDSETERLWVQEAERRYQAYKQGRLPARDATEAIRNAQAQLR